MSTARDLAHAFMRDNLKAIATERRYATPSLMPKTSLFFQAARLFADADVVDSVSFTEAELHRLCIIYVSENAK